MSLLHRRGVAPKRALTVRSRLALALAKRKKKQEQRNYSIGRQLLNGHWTLVHAGETPTEHEPHGRMLDMLAPGECLEDPAVRGKIVGAMHVSELIRTDAALTDPMLAPWVVNDARWPYAAVVDDAILFDEPVEAKGWLGVWTAKSRMSGAAYSRLLVQLESHGFDIGDEDEEVMVSDLGAFQRHGRGYGETRCPGCSLKRGPASSASSSPASCYSDGSDSDDSVIV